MRLARSAEFVDFDELALTIRCKDDELVGIVSKPRVVVGSVGVVIVVGGPQYRVGSHRQFVKLARHLAAAGVPCMRFDYRGMGDATGEQRSFEHVGADIGVATETLFAHVPALTRVVLWGLCDGASASCYYAAADARVAGVLLVNPWIRTDAGQAGTMLERHYAKRLASREFWHKLLRGRVALVKALRELAVTLRSAAAGPGASSGSSSLPARMAAALAKSGVPFCIALSGRDFVAGEFERELSKPGAWSALLSSDRCIAVERLPDADHTLSSDTSRNAVAALSVQWVKRLAGVAPGGY